MNSDIDWGVASGWVATIFTGLSLITIWVFRSVSVTRKLSVSEGKILTRLDIMEDRQNRMSKRSFDEMKEMRQMLHDHINKG